MRNNPGFSIKLGVVGCQMELNLGFVLAFLGDGDYNVPGFGGFRIGKKGSPLHAFLRKGLRRTDERRILKKIIIQSVSILR